jgi:ECF sigma factor
MGDVTHILLAIERGDLQAAEKLLPLVYEELRRLATQRLAREDPGQSLQSLRPGARGLSQARRRR